MPKTLNQVTTATPIKRGLKVNKPCWRHHHSSELQLLSRLKGDWKALDKIADYAEKEVTIAIPIKRGLKAAFCEQIEYRVTCSYNCYPD